MQPAYRVGRMASATQPRRREQVNFQMTEMRMKVMVMVMIGENWDDDGDALWASATQPRRREQVIFKMTVMMMKVMVMMGNEY